jgi:uncharacterized protein (TIGR02145 family)
LSSPGYCYYNNTTSADSIKKFGALYNWYTVDSKILGFPGWHVPSEADWDTMEAYLTNNGYNYDETIGGEKIAKSLAAQTDWQASSNVGAVGNDLTLNNTSGFSGLPAGARNYQGIFGLISNDGYWWNSAAYSASLGDTRILSNWALLFNHNCGPKSSGFSVRLVKD